MQTGTRTHAELSKATAAQGGRECNAQDMTFGGRCLNCGFGEETMQTKTTHTPGPWTVTVDGLGNNAIASSEALDPVTEARYDFIATVFYRSTGAERFRNGQVRTITKGETEANANLIAAAPALLEALEAAIPFLEMLHGHNTNELARHARAAIAQARGEAS